MRSCDAGWRWDLDTHRRTEHCQRTTNVWYILQCVLCRPVCTGLHLPPVHWTCIHTFELLGRITCITAEMRPIATYVTRSVVCVFVCWAHGWAVQKWMNWARCYLEGQSYHVCWMGVRSFICYCRRGSNRLLTPSLRPYVGPMRQPKDRRRIGRYVLCVCVTCRVKEGLSRSEQLVRYFYDATPLGVAICLAKPELTLLQRQPEDFAIFMCFGLLQRG